MSELPITFVVAPGIPTSERLALEAHVKEAVLDPEYTLVLNYEAMIFEFVIPENSKVLVIAPGVPVNEVKDLRERFDKVRDAEKLEDRVLVVNYEARIDVLSPDEDETASYGEAYRFDIEDTLGG